ncbi:MAG: hypothetical protein JJV98_16585 [Desulfosarcina sp.]|nr:hypothetical protein [Desulfobacterales bacterium]
MLNVKVAKLHAEDLEAIRAFEKTLGGNVCLLAVEKSEALYVLEAKLAPNRWHRVDRVYLEITDLKAFYDRHEDAHTAKAALKTFLNSTAARNITKRPIRLRLSVPIIDDE